MPSDTDDVKDGRAASRALKLDDATLALVAKERGMTLPQLRARLGGLLFEAAEAGDVSAIREMNSYVAAAWIGGGGNSSKAMARRLRAGMRRGVLNLEHADRVTKLVKMQRELETSDLERRLEALEAVAGEVVHRHHEANGGAE